MKLRPVAVLLGSLALGSCSRGSGGGGNVAPDAGKPTADVAILPDAGVSDSSVPDLTIPDAVMPDVAVPDTAIPDAAMPDVAGPDVAVHDAALPDMAVPDVAVSDAALPTTPDATVSGSLPRFVDQPDAGGSNQLLTCIAHLYGQTIGGVPLHPINPVSVANPGSSPADVIVTAQIQSYSDPSSVGLHVPASGTASTPPIDLTFDFPALYAVSAPVTANVTLQLASAGNAALLDAHTRSITILPKNTIYWTMPDGAGNAVDTRPFIGAFVTPHDQAGSVDRLLKDAASYSRFNAMIGYQYTSSTAQPVSGSPWSGSASPGYCATTSLQLAAGDVLDLSVEATCSLCVSNNVVFAIFTQADWQGAQSSPLGSTGGLGSWSGQFAAPASDTYVLAACNPSSNTSNRSVTISATTNPILTGAIDQMGAIFLALKARGMQYVNVPQGFFANAQNVKFPVESLATASANCIDGTLVFASALESMQMRPGIAMLSDHAFIAVLADPSADPCNIANWLPMETTMVSSDTPVAAVNYDVQNKMPEVVQVAASECSGLAQNVPTIWDVQSLRSLGILPAPM